MELHEIKIGELVKVEGPLGGVFKLDWSTEKALCIGRVWIPYSQIIYVGTGIHEDVKDGPVEYPVHIINIPEWLIDKSGLGRISGIAY